MLRANYVRPIERPLDVFRSHADQLIDSGLAVFPLLIGGKKPAIKAWQKDATRSRNQARAWAARWPSANIGIACGLCDPQLVVIDVDGDNGAGTMHDLVEEHDVFPATWSVITRKGSHLYFRAPPAVRIKNSQSLIGQGIDVRGPGGYVVAPPSIRNGKQAYTWEPGHAPWEVALADLPDWLLDLLIAGNREPEDLPPPAEPKPPVKDGWGPKPSYAQKALEAAAEAIARAGDGYQQTTLMQQSFGIGQLLGAGLMPIAYAEAVLIRAGMEMENTKANRWTRREVAECVRRGLDQGQRRPREPRERR